MNELDSVNSNGSPAWDSARYLREILKAPVYEAVEHTPLQEMPTLPTCLGSTVEAKREDLQTVHFFKIHGAYNVMRSLNPAERERGVATTPTGNHVQGAARPVAMLRMSAIVATPIITPQIKVDAVRVLGDEVRPHGGNLDAAKAEATRLAEVESLSYVVPFGDPRVIAGQGAIGLELIQQDTHLDHVFIPIGDGGLAADVAVFIKQLMPGIKVIGVEHEESAYLKVALLGGESIIPHHVGLFAEGAAVCRVGEGTLRICWTLLDGVVTVSSDETFAAVCDIFDDVRAIFESSGVPTLVGLKRYAAEHHLSGERLAFALSGASLDSHQLRYISERSEIGEQHEVILGVTIPEEQDSFLRFASALGVCSVTEFSYRLSVARAETDPARVFVGVRIARRQERVRIVTDPKEAGHDVIDLTDDEFVKVHVCSMIGRHVTPGVPERLLSSLFPESPEALAHFFEVLGTRWNITLSHYCADGADYGRILCTFAAEPDDVELTEHMDRLGYFYNEETADPAFCFSLARQSATSSRLHVPPPEGRRWGIMAGIM